MLLKMEREKSERSLAGTESDIESSDEEDEYEANIEFSNAFRNYYLSRVEATETFKKDMRKDGHKPKGEQKRSTIDDKMEKLRKEMASLMDQDVSLMQQLLTLNETINEIKQGRLAASSKGSVSSRGFVSGSDWSMTASEMSLSPDDQIPPFSLIRANLSNKNSDVKDILKRCESSQNNIWKVQSQSSNDSGYVEEIVANEPSTGTSDEQHTDTPNEQCTGIRSEQYTDTHNELHMDTSNEQCTSNLSEQCIGTSNEKCTNTLSEQCTEPPCKSKAKAKIKCNELAPSDLWKVQSPTLNCNRNVEQQQNLLQTDI